MRLPRLGLLLVRLSAGLRIRGRVIACGTRYDPLTEEEAEIVDILNENALLLAYFEKYPIPAPQIISNELGDLARRLREEGFGLSRVERFKYDDPEVALVSKMVLDETRYVYCRIPGGRREPLESLAREFECTEYWSRTAWRRSTRPTHCTRRSSRIPTGVSSPSHHASRSPCRRARGGR